MFTCVTFTDGMKMRGVKGAANGNAKSRNSVVSCVVVKDECFCFTFFRIDPLVGVFCFKQY